MSSCDANVAVTNSVESVGSNRLHGSARGFFSAASAGIAFNNPPLAQAPEVNVRNFLWLSTPQSLSTEAEFNELELVWAR